MPDLTRAATRLGSALVVAAVLAACGAPATASQPASAEPPVAATPAASAPASDTPALSAPPEASPAASVVVPSLGATTPLVDILPAELGGEPTQKIALTGDDLTTLDAATAMVFGSVGNVLGTDDADMTIGAATNSKASVIAIRVAGKSAEEIGDAMIAGRTLNAETTKEDLELGGKPVIKVVTTIATVPFYVYGTGDVSFTVAGLDETLVAEALSKLP